jgi:hypothetical protein
LRCEVCGAPSLPLHGACAFCRSPLEAASDPAGLLEYVAGCLPSARASRGWLGRSPLKELQVEAAGVRYSLSRRPGGLRLRPAAPPAEWVDLLLADLSKDAAANPQLRSQMTRAGWALR